MTFIPGLGSVPSDWAVERARWLLDRQRREVRSIDGVVTAFRDGRVTLRANRRVDGFTEAEKEIGYQGIRRGDLVVHGMDGFAGAIGVSDSDGKSSPVVHAYISKRSDLRYLAHVLREMARSGFIASLAKGIRERSTAFDAVTLANLELPVPPMEEQRRIADFLDVETERLDRLANLMMRQFVTLGSRRSAVLAGVWGDGLASLARLGYFLDLVTSGPRGWGDYVSPRGNLFLRSANLRRDSIAPNLESVSCVDPPEEAAAEAMRSRISEDDVLIGITGANTGWVALADAAVSGANVSQHVALLRPTPSLRGRWLAYLLSSPRVQDELLSSQYGGTKTQLSLPDLRDLRTPLLTLDVQDRLVDIVEAELVEIEGERKLRIRQMELLAERRQALITAAVTGQIDVTTARRVSEGSV